MGIRTGWRGHVRDVICAVFDPTGARVVTSGADGTVRIWDATTGAPVRTMHVSSQSLYAVAVSPDGRRVAIADEDMDRSTEQKTSAVHFLRFEFAADAIAALKTGAALHFGIDDPRMPLRFEATGPLRAALLVDFD